MNGETLVAGAIVFGLAGGWLLGTLLRGLL